MLTSRSTGALHVKTNRSAWWLVLLVGVVLQIALIGGLVWQFQRSLEA